MTATTDFVVARNTMLSVTLAWRIRSTLRQRRFEGRGRL